MDFPLHPPIFLVLQASVWLTWRYHLDFVHHEDFFPPYSSCPSRGIFFALNPENFNKNEFVLFVSFVVSHSSALLTLSIAFQRFTAGMFR